ncbi:MAG: hypothetical protein WAO52_17925 [Prolixibacteraceae bacterium]
MKTTNNAQKTENRNLGNTMFRTFIATGLVLFGLAANASDFRIQLQEKENNENQELLAYASNETIAARSFFIETSKESKLNIESWMTDEQIFGNNQFTEQISQEKKLEIETWMIDSPYFETPNISADRETELNVESWMTNHTQWNK